MAHNGFNNYSLRNVKLSDFRHIVDFLSVHGRVSTSPSTWADRAKKIAAVRTSAFEDHSIVFEQQYFPQDHPNILARFENPIKEEKRLARYNIPEALQIPLCWIAGPRHGHLEVCPDHPRLKKEVDFVRCCLIPEMEVGCQGNNFSLEHC
jgi:hypothetical protein